MSDVPAVTVVDSGIKVTITTGKRTQITKTTPKPKDFAFDNPMTSGSDGTTSVLTVDTLPTDSKDSSSHERKRLIPTFVWFGCILAIVIIIIAGALGGTLVSNTSTSVTNPALPLTNPKLITFTLNASCTGTGPCTVYNYTTITDLRCTILNLTGFTNSISNGNGAFSVQVFIEGWIESNGTVRTISPTDPLNSGTCTETGRLIPNGVLGSVPISPVAVNVSMITVSSSSTSSSVTDTIDQLYATDSFRVQQCYIDKVYVAATPSVTPTATPTSSETATPSSTISNSNSPTSSVSYSSTSTGTSTGTSTMTATGTNTPSSTPSPTGTDTPSPSSSLSSTNTGTATTTSTGTDTPSASVTPSNSPTSSNTCTPTPSTSTIVQIGNWRTSSYSYWFTPTSYLMSTNTLDSFDNFAHAAPFTVTATTTISRLAFLFYFRGTVGASYTFNIAILAAGTQANSYIPTGSILASKTGLVAPASTAQTINTFVPLEIMSSSLGALGTYSLAPGVYNLVIYGASSNDVTLSHHNSTYASVVNYGGNFAPALTANNKCIFPYLSGSSATGSWGPACQSWCGKGIVNDCFNFHIE